MVRERQLPWRRTFAVFGACAVLAGCGVVAEGAGSDAAEPSVSASPTPDSPPLPYDPVAFGPGTLDCEAIEMSIPSDFWDDDGNEIKRDFTDTIDDKCIWLQLGDGREISVHVEAVAGDGWRTWEEEAEGLFDTRTDHGGMATLTGLGEAAAFAPAVGHVLGDLTDLQLVVREGNLVLSFTAMAFDGFDTESSFSALNYRTASFASLALVLTGMAEAYLTGIGAENAEVAEPAPPAEDEASELPDICGRHGLDGFTLGDEHSQVGSDRAWCHLTAAAAGADLWINAETYIPLGQEMTGTDQATWLMWKKLTDSDSTPADFGDEANFTVVGLEDGRRTYRFVIRVGNTILNAVYMASNTELEAPAEEAARETAEQIGTSVEALLADA